MNKMTTILGKHANIQNNSSNFSRRDISNAAQDHQRFINVISNYFRSINKHASLNTRASTIKTDEETIFLPNPSINIIHSHLVRVLRI